MMKARAVVNAAKTARGMEKEMRASGPRKCSHRDMTDCR